MTYILLKNVSPCSTDQISILVSFPWNDKEVPSKHVLNREQSRRPTEQLQRLFTYLSQKDVEKCQKKRVRQHA